MGAKVRGISQAKKNLDDLIGNIQGRKTVRAIQSALLIGGAQSSIYTPIDTATLLNSQFREISVNRIRVTGRVGYSASYAAYVHDPNVPQNFRRATAKKEFLVKGFEDTRKQIDAAVYKEMSI